MLKLMPKYGNESEEYKLKVMSMSQQEKRHKEIATKEINKVLSLFEKHSFWGN